MGRVRAGMQSSGSTAQPRRNEISLLVRQASGLAWSGVGMLAGFRRTPPESFAQMNGTDQIAGRSGEACHLSATAPTLVPSESRCSRFGASVSFATPPLLMQRLVCCIDRLNPQPKAVTGESLPIAVLGAPPASCGHQWSQPKSSTFGLQSWARGIYRRPTVKPTSLHWRSAARRAACKLVVLYGD